ncbi:hypothetical protein [Pseudoduganella lutea]|uniref:Uncharacterized protein n=1 Tax=Pseudoduganella lutea TaxID=321985 RepID=A0A4P6L2W6_9BURK|nr:hypothetical protein [Pseudoduganella lutea]QBE65777.1 hypothetical protein EWM63_24670 [Pseudoduganella lutea]
MICTATDGWSACSVKVKQAIAAATTPQQAFGAAQEWGERYDKLYAANSQAGWTASDQERMRDLGESMFDETIGKYLDPATLAFALAMKKFFPTLSSLFGILSNPWVVGFYMVLAPSPIANDFTAAKPVNDDINKLLLEKFNSFMPLNWRDDYSDMMQRAYLQIKDGGLP